MSKAQQVVEIDLILPDDVAEAIIKELRDRQMVADLRTPLSLREQQEIASACRAFECSRLNGAIG